VDGGNERARQARTVATDGRLVFIREEHGGDVSEPGASHTIGWC